MTWHHRVLRHVEPSGEEWFAIHEVFEQPTSGHRRRPPRNHTPSTIEGLGGTRWTVNPVDVRGSDLPEIARTLQWMLKALGEPILDAMDAPYLEERA